CLVAVELKAGNCCNQRLQQRLALDEGQGWRCRGRRDAGDRKRNRRAEPRVNRQAIIANAAQFAVEIRGFRPHLRERFNYAQIFVAPVESVRVSNCIRTRSMRADIRKPSSFISWSMAVPRKRSTSWQSWGGIQRGSGEA